MASPGAKQTWPTMAACWSPRSPATGTSPPNGPFVAGRAVGRPGPTTSRISGSIARGTPKNAEQLVVPVERLEVHQHRAAGVGDVGDVQAAVGTAGQVPDQPACPSCRRARRPASASARTPSTFSRIQWSLPPEKYVRRRQAGALRGSGRRARRGRARRRSRRCGCPARRSRCGSGWPVRRSHTTVVSRWLVMPTRREVGGVDARPCRSAVWTTSCGALPDLAGSCSTQPACGRICSCSSWWRTTSVPAWSNTMNRVLVVPWSMAPTYSATAPLWHVSPARSVRSAARRARSSRSPPRPAHELILPSRLTST